MRFLSLAIVLASFSALPAFATEEQFPLAPADHWAYGNLTCFLNTPGVYSMNSEFVIRIVTALGEDGEMTRECQLSTGGSCFSGPREIGSEACEVVVRAQGRLTQIEVSSHSLKVRNVMFQRETIPTASSASILWEFDNTAENRTDRYDVVCRPTSES